ncbi:MAG: hypothetical protein M0C28_42275 [Candidatus Moduliflexus flocculans]|nr:hypothetical protein [Candidatus Moduliflexus flocculans]
MPKRLTYTPSLGRDDISDRMGPNNLVMGWTHDGEADRLPLPDAPNGTISTASSTWPRRTAGRPSSCPCRAAASAPSRPTTRKLAYNRIFREFRTWKRYRGGMADDIWIYDFATKTVENITANPALDIIPMWSGDRIYFLSDRDDAQADEPLRLRPRPRSRRGS